MFDRVRHKGLTSNCCTLLSPCLKSPAFIHSFAAHTQPEHDFLPPSLSLLSLSLHVSMSAGWLPHSWHYEGKSLTHWTDVIFTTLFPSKSDIRWNWHYNCSWATVAHAAVACQPVLLALQYSHLHAVMKRSVPRTCANEQYKQRNDIRLLNSLYPPPKKETEGNF